MLITLWSTISLISLWTLYTGGFLIWLILLLIVNYTPLVLFRIPTFTLLLQLPGVLASLWVTFDMLLPWSLIGKSLAMGFVDLRLWLSNLWCIFFINFLSQIVTPSFILTTIVLSVHIPNAAVLMFPSTFVFIRLMWSSPNVSFGLNLSTSNQILTLLTQSHMGNRVHLPILFSHSILTCLVNSSPSSSAISNMYPSMVSCEIADVGSPCKLALKITSNICPYVCLSTPPPPQSCPMVSTNYSSSNPYVSISTPAPPLPCLPMPNLLLPLPLPELSSLPEIWHAAAASLPPCSTCQLSTCPRWLMCHPLDNSPFSWGSCLAQSLYFSMSSEEDFQKTPFCHIWCHSSILWCWTAAFHTVLQLWTYFWNLSDACFHHPTFFLHCWCHWHLHRAVHP